jgi:hypothetical protein
MKKHIFYFLIFFITINSSWQIDNPVQTKISIINNTKIKIDSAVFFINNYHNKIKIIKGGKEKQKIVKIVKSILNHHDITVRIDLFIAGKIFRSNYFYNDLNGELSEKYIFTLKKDSTTQLISVN